MQVRNGPADFAAYAANDVTHGCGIYRRLRVSAGDALIASEFGIYDEHKKTTQSTAGHMR